MTNDTRSRQADPLTFARSCLENPQINLAGLATVTGLSRSWLHALKAGKITNCTLDQVNTLVKHFGHRISVVRSARR